MPISRPDLEVAFHSGLDSQDAEQRRAAAFEKLKRWRLSNRVTVEQFLKEVQSQKELWAVVSKLGVVELAALLTGRSLPPIQARPPRRGRLSKVQKNALRLTAVLVLTRQAEGLSRAGCARAILEDGLLPLGLARGELAAKLGPILHELLQEGRLHTDGKTRQMRYRLGRGQPKQTS